MKKILRLFTIALGLVVVGLLIWRIFLFRNVAGSAVPTYGAVADFQLTDQTGRPFGSADLRGKIWVADFVFTRCMGPCPMLTARMAKLQSEFSSKPDLHFVSFSVDPEFDTPAVLKKYAATYGADGDRWHFLTGPKQTVFDLIRNNFRLAVQKQPNQDVAITDIMHSLHFVLVDREGRILGYFNSTDEEALKALREKLQAS